MGIGIEVIFLLWVLYVYLYRVVGNLELWIMKLICDVVVLIFLFLLLLLMWYYFFSVMWFLESLICNNLFM